MPSDSEDRLRRMAVTLVQDPVAVRIAVAVPAQELAWRQLVVLGHRLEHRLAASQGADVHPREVPRGRQSRVYRESEGAVDQHLGSLRGEAPNGGPALEGL